MTKLKTLQIVFAILGISSFWTIKAQIQNSQTLNEPINISKDFENYENTFYFADELVSFNPETGQGALKYKRYEYQTRQAFNNMLMKPDRVPANEFPATEYAESPELPFQIQFVSDRTVRIKMISGPQFNQPKESLMLVEGTAPNHPE